MNATVEQDYPNSKANEQVEEIFFWFTIAITALGCTFGVFANGLVIYLANQNPERGTFAYLNSVVRNLAITDFLYCVVGIPLTATWYIWGKLWFYLGLKHFLHQPTL